MTYVLSTIAIGKIFSLISWYSKKKMETPVKSPFWTFQLKAMKENLPQSCFIKEISFRFKSISCCISIAKNHIKYFMLQLLLKFYLSPGQQQTRLISQNVLIFFWYRRKSKVVNVPVSFLLKKMCIHCTVFVLQYFNRLLEENSDLWKAYLVF